MKKRFLLTLFMVAFAIFANAQTHWVAPSNMQYNMSGNAVVFVNGSSIMGSSDVTNIELGAFVGDDCRGCALPQTVPFGAYAYQYSIMLYSETGNDELTFRLYNHETEEEECLNCTTSINFVIDGSIGNVIAPLQVNFVDAVCFNVTVTANPTAGGTVTGGGHIREGNPCTVSATADGCYQFVNWTAGSTAISTNATYTFTPTEDIDLVANFQAGTYEITATVDPAQTGTVTGAGTYDCGSTCTLTASPAAGYQFVNWTNLAGAEVSTNAEYSFTVNEAGSYIAHFSLIPYEITATANPTAGGTVAVEGPLTYGSTCTLTATAAEHYNFLNWTKGGEIVSTNAVYSFTVEGAGAYVANFELIGCEIITTVNPANAGTATGGGVVVYGGSCTLTATANDGYQFVNWTNLLGGIVSTTPTYTFTVLESAEYIANFEPKSYTITVSANPAEGAIDGTTTGGGTYTYGQQCHLRTVTKLGYQFNNWTLNDEVVGTETDYYFTVNDATEGAYVANFSLVDPLPAVPTETHWTFSDNAQYNMTVTGVMILDAESMQNNDLDQYLEIGAFVGDECRGSYLPTHYDLPFVNGYVYEITIYSDNIGGEQIMFKVWNHIADAELDVTCLTEMMFIANENYGNLMDLYELEFETNLTPHYNITAVANPAEGGTVTGAGSYEEGETCTLTATADEHYNFFNWTMGNEVVSTEATYTFTVTADGSYIANFTPKEYEIAVNVPAVGGTVTGAGTYSYNTQCVLTATPAEGYHFVNWKLAGAVVSTDGSYGFTVTGDATYDAEFEINSYEITAVASPSVGGEVEGAGTYNHFQECTLTATPNAKFKFMGWTKGGEPVSTDEELSITFVVTEAADYVANFAPIYTIAASIVCDPQAEGHEVATIEGAGDYVKGDDWTLTATANTGYTFLNWNEVIGEESEFYSDETTISENAQADRTFEAYFLLNTYNISVTVAPDETPEVAQLDAAGTVTGYGDYHHYDTCTLVATPSLGYHFVNWTVGEEVLSTDANYSFEVVESVALVANFELDTHDITVTIVDVTENKPEAAPEIPGTVTGYGTFNYYETCTLVATPEVGYHFVNWTEGGVDVSTDTTIEFMVTADRDLVANFELDTHDITVTVVNLTEDLPDAAPEIPGTVTGAGTYNYYATCTLVATPEVGYHFVNWTEGGEVISTETTLEFMVIEDRDFVANFEIDSHVIAITVVDLTEDKPEAAPEIPGTVTGAGTYYYYTEITLVATPEVGFHFVNWTEGGEVISTETTLEFMVVEDRDLIANFELDTHDITVTVVNLTEDLPEAAPEIPGTVTGAGTYNYYTEITLVATPEVGYHFVNWTEGGEVISTETTLEFMVVEDRDLVANFEIDSHVIDVTVVNLTEDLPEAAPEIPGTVTGAGTYYYYTEITLVATPEVGYHFVNWTEDGEVISTETTLEFMVVEDRDLMANFELDVHTLTLTLANITEDTPAAAPAIPGTVTINDGEYILDDNNQVDLYYYTEITLVATPEVGYHFVNWIDVVTGEEIKDGGGQPVGPEYEFMVVEDRNIRANFELDTHVITATVADLTEDVPAAAPQTPGTVTGAGTFNYYATCTLVATPATGYHFVNWTENGVVIEEATTTTYEFMVTADRNIVANFELNNYTIAATPNNSQYGSVTGAGNYNYYATCELVATPAEGYHFVNWTEGGQAVSTDATYSFMVTSARTLVANFAINTYEITVTANPTAGGTVSGAGTYNHFSTCTAVATVATGYHFLNWTANGEVVTTELTYSFEVTEAVALVANFEINSYEIVAQANPATYGTVTGGGTYNHFQNCTLVATAEQGHTFVNWTKDGVDYSTEASITFMVEGAATFVAHFINRYTITATANNATYGTVAGAGIYNEGENVTLTATPNTGYHFVNWTLNGQEVSTNATYTFVAAANGDYVGNFAINNYAITASVDPAGYGTITGAGNYDHFATCTLTATANENYYQFVNWTLNGQEVGTNPTYTFTVTGAAEYVAHFVLITHEITAVMNPTDAGTVTGAGTYYHTNTCTLVANPTQDYLFMNWTENGNVVSTDATYTFTVTGDRALVANCIPNSYEITASASPYYGGSVSGAGVYNYNTQCTLVATANTGFYFVNWTDNDGTPVSTDASWTFTVTADASYVANFAAEQYTIVTMCSPAEGGVITDGNGNVITEPLTYNYGQTCVVIAQPNEGYHFVNWTDDSGNVLSQFTDYMFNVTGYAMVVANFELDSFTITASASPSYGGTVEGAGTYNYGESCTLTATPNTGYHFVNWTMGGDEVTTDATYTFTVYANGNYVAHFEIDTFEITAVANPAEGGSVTGAGTYNYGASCTLSAAVADGYNFVNWTTVAGQVVTTDASFTFTVTEDADYVANFEEIIINTYDVTVTVDPEGYGTVTGAGTYEEGETCTLTATATSGHVFVHWIENGTVVSEDAVYSFVVTENHDFVAVFDLDGVGEIGDIHFVMYPNPATDKLMVESSQFVRKCEIFSVNGALIYTMYECSETFEVNVSGYAVGSYIIRLTTDKSVQMKSFMKK